MPPGMYWMLVIGTTAKNARCAATPTARPASGAAQLRHAVADREQRERHERAEEQRVAVARRAEQREVPRRQAVRQRVDDRQRRQRRRDVRQEEQARRADQDAGEVAGAELHAEAATTSARGDRARHQQAEAELPAAAVAARAFRIAAGASMMPAPYLSVVYVWLFGLRARVLQDLLDLSGSVTPSPTTSAATPATCGDAIDVPMYAEYSSLRRVADLDRVLQDAAIGVVAAAVRVARVAARRGDVDVLAVVRVERDRLVVLRRADRDRAGIRGRIADLAAALVASGAHDGDALVVRVLDRLLQHARRERTAERHVDDLRAVVGRVANRVGDAGDRARAASRRAP